MKKALIVVDYQNDFVDGALGFEKAPLLEPVIVEKITRAREEGSEVLFTFDTHTENYLQTQEGKNLPIPHCIQGSEGWKLFGKVSQMVQPQDRCFYKPCFGSWELAEYAREQNFEQMELCGLVSNSVCCPTQLCLKQHYRKQKFWWMQRQQQALMRA